MIEYALMLPLLVLVFLAIINLGLVVHEHQILQNAAREGARFSSLPSSNLAQNPYALTQIRARVIEYGHNENITILPEQISVDQTWDIPAGDVTLHGSAVTIQYNRPLLLPGAGALPVGGLTLTARAVFCNLYY